MIAYIVRRLFSTIVVMAVVARRLDDLEARKRALTFGRMFSFGLRLVGLLIASLLIKAWPLRALGARLPGFEVGRTGNHDCVEL